MLQALAPPQAVLPLTAIPVCAFFASGGGDINSRAALMPTRPTGRDAFERRAPSKAAYEVSGEIEAGRTSGQAGPKPHHAGCDDEVRSAGFGKAPQQTVFQILSAGQNLKNTQVRPHLPCLPKRADSKIAVFEIMLLSPLVFYRRIC